MAAGPRLWAALEQRFGRFFSPEDQLLLRNEVQRRLGLDPFSVRGLQTAGLPPTGRMVGGLFENGESLWVFPVADAERAWAAVRQWMEARRTTEEMREDAGGSELATYIRAQGETLASFATHRKFGFLGTGAGAEQRVRLALRQAPEHSLANYPLYRSLAFDIGDAGVIRGVFPTGVGLVRALGEWGRSLDSRLLRDLKGGAWTLVPGVDELRLAGRIRVDGVAGLGLGQLLQRPKTALAPGVRAVGLEQAIVVAVARGAPREFAALIAPPGSRNRRRLDRLLAPTGLSDSHRVLEAWSGQVGAALGLRRLDEVTVLQLVEDPTSLVWTALSVGAKAPAAMLMSNGTTKKRIAALSPVVETKATGDMTTAKVAPRDTPATPRLQSFAKPGAALFVNEDFAARAVLDHDGGGADPLRGQSGLHVKAHIGRLAQQLESFGLQKVPIMFRSSFRRTIEGLSLFDRATAVVKWEKGNLRLDARLAIAPGSARR